MNKKWTSSFKGNTKYRSLDLASGGREDGLATTDQLRKHNPERKRESDEVMKVWRENREQGEYQ